MKFVICLVQEIIYIIIKDNYEGEESVVNNKSYKKLIKIEF